MTFFFLSGFNHSFVVEIMTFFSSKTLILFQMKTVKHFLEGKKNCNKLIDFCLEELEISIARDYVFLIKSLAFFSIK